MEITCCGKKVGALVAAVTLFGIGMLIGKAYGHEFWPYLAGGSIVGGAVALVAYKTHQCMKKRCGNSSKIV